MLRAKCVLLICLVGCLVGCLPAGNTDPEVFRAEWNAVSEVLGDPVALHDMSFVTMPYDELQEWCNNDGCLGHQEWNTIMLANPPIDHCDSQDGNDEKFGSVVIHEMLHVNGFDHGDHMYSAQERAWSKFAAMECDF